MTFRLKVFSTIAAVVVAISLVEAGLDVATSRGRSWMEAETERSLLLYMDSLAMSIDLRGEVPIRSGFVAAIEAPRRRSTYRILVGERVVHGERDTFPAPEPGWVWAHRDLVGGYRLEVALRRTAIERFLANDLLVDLVDLPLFLSLAFLLSWLLARNIIRPVRELTVASEQLSRQQRPEPIAVPTGDDELSRMARSFNAMSASIQGYLERERVFTRYASHELRTPLSALRAQVERARLNLATSDEILPAMERNILRMEVIIGALLALARSSERDPEVVVLAPLVEELVRSVPPADRDRVTIDGAALGTVYVTDARLVQQGLQNLLENALRHTTGRVAIRIDVRDEWLTMRVSDQGPGLPEKVLAGPIEPFVNGGRRGGLGLGLSLVASIAQALNGTLELRNTPVGLRATLNLAVLVKD